MPSGMRHSLQNTVRGTSCFDSRSKHRLIVPPQLFKKGAQEVVVHYRIFVRASLVHDRADRLSSINEVKYSLLTLINREKQILVGVSAIDQHGSGSTRHPVLNTDSVADANWDIAQPRFAIETHIMLTDIGVIALQNGTMAGHRPAE